MRRLVIAVLVVAGVLAFMQPPQQQRVRIFSTSAAQRGPLAEGRRARPLSVGEFLRAYGIDEAHRQGLDGSGVTVVIPAIDSYSASDLSKFAQTNRLPEFRLKEVGDRPDADYGELVMDLQIVHAVAPAAKLVAAYWPTTGNDADTIRSVASRFRGAVWSWSIGWCEGSFPFGQRAVADALQKSVEAGAAHFAATGDSGGYECYPSGKLFAPPERKFIGLIMPSSARSVTAVGGTRLVVDGRGVKETPWYRSVTLSGSGGGVSRVFRGRTVPDVAGNADPATGMRFYWDGGIAAAGGTSASAPLWAGIGALTAQALRRKGLSRTGGFNELLAQIAKSEPAAFRHPRVGSNAVAVAQPGRDQVTGWGAPVVPTFIDAAVQVSR